MVVYDEDNFKFFDYALNSLVMQSIKEFEVVLVINGNINIELKRVIEKYNDILNMKCLQLNRNYGLAYALNEGLNICSGDYIARMDSDDISLPERFEIQKKYLDKYKSIDILGSAIQDINSFGKLSSKTIYPKSHAECKNRFRYRDPVAHPTVMFRREFFVKAGRYDNDYKKNQDTILWMNGFLSGCKFSNIQDVLLCFRINDNLFNSRRGGIKKAKEIFKLRLQVNKKMKFGIDSYIFLVMEFFIRIMPSRLLRIIYLFR